MLICSSSNCLYWAEFFCHNMYSVLACCVNWNGDIYYCHNMSKNLNFLSRIYQKHLHWNVNACPCQILNKEKCKESWIRSSKERCHDVMKEFESKCPVVDNCSNIQYWTNTEQKPQHVLFKAAMELLHQNKPDFNTFCGWIK